MTDIALQGASASDAAQTSPVDSFSFEGLHEKAMAYGSETPAAATPPAEQVAEPVVPEPVVEEVASAPAATLAQLKDEDLVEVTVDGEPVQMTWKEARGGVQRQSHYTKSMQQLRQEQAAFESERVSLAKASEERQVLAGLLQNPEMLKQFIAKQYPALLQQQQAIASAAANVDPDDIATVGQIQAAQQQLIQQQQAMQEQFLQSVAAREEQLTRTIEDRQATAKLSAEINTTVKGLFNEHQHVADLIPNAEQVLRYEVLQLKPSTPEETVEAFKTVFGGWVEKYDASVKARTKSTAIAKHKLATNNIQPPGGTAPQAAPVSFKKTNKHTGKTEVDWDALRAHSMSLLNSK